MKVRMLRQKGSVPLCIFILIPIVSAEINQGRKLFKGGNYSKAETIRGNTVVKVGLDI